MMICRWDRQVNPEVDHEVILNTIKTRKPELARKTMEQHPDKLISEVDRYREQVFPQRDKR